MAIPQNILDELNAADAKLADAMAADATAADSADASQKAAALASSDRDIAHGLHAEATALASKAVTDLEGYFGLTPPAPPPAGTLMRRSAR